MEERKIHFERKTNETDIQLTLNLDGNGTSRIQTGIGFFDHMLTAFALHSGMDLELMVTGDLFVDCHHTVEDAGIALGKAFAELLKDKSQIERFGTFFVPMDESLAFCSLDISGRPFLVFQAAFQNQSIGQFDCCMTEEFFRAFAFQSGITLHIQILHGTNDHHKVEAIFKAVAHSLQQAIRFRSGGILSTKGVL